MYGYHLFPFDVETTELSSGRSRRDTLQQLGIRVSTVPRVTRKVDAINAAVVLLPRVCFNEEKTLDLLDRLALYRREFDERLQVYREKPAHHGLVMPQTHL